jgi:hypothetical protein
VKEGDKQMDKNLQILSFCQYLKEKFDQVKDEFELEELEKENKTKIKKPKKIKKKNRKQKIKSTKTVKTMFKNEFEPTKKINKKSIFVSSKQPNKLIKMKTLSGQWDPEVEIDKSNMVWNKKQNPNNINGIVGCKDEEEEEQNYMSVFNKDATEGNFNPMKSQKILTQELKNCRNEIEELRNQMENRTRRDYLNRTKEVGFEGEMMKNNSYIDSLENSLKICEQEKEFFKAKLQECEARLLERKDNNISGDLHTKLHLQQELIDKLKTDLCNANIRWNEKVKELESQLSYEKGQNRELKAHLEKNEKEIKNVNIHLTQNLTELDTFKNKNEILEVRLRNRENEIEILNRTIDQMQDEIKRALKKSNSSGTGDWELETLKQMANKLCKESTDLYHIENGHF